ncbi:TBC1 domain family member 19 [Acyrthosiphon pisum]|uniref:Rab-GAP TBC domain-containing protein n=1 Tax=Acyrthosiphon pisum TaxID=7029 RepID=A0A8R2D4S7_ACYPI|nr:TBC1 domain family member 19 [Acyrthosiphon pisum]|eukprot:XP_016661472.1 PREDICTED: TBC1 domain family member 19-like [Acyrthosiphon pisum]
MGELKDKSLYLTAGELAEELQKMDINNGFYEDLQMLAASKDVPIDDFKNTLVQAVNIGNMETNLRNAVFHWLRSHGNNKQIVVRDEKTSREPLDYLRKAQITWETRIQKSLESISKEIGINLSCLRSCADRDDILRKWNEFSTYNTSLERLIPVYAPKDFLEVLFSLHNPNYKMLFDDMIWDFTYLPLKVKTLPELIHHYRDLATADLMLGLTTLSCGSTSQGGQERIALGEKVLQHQHAPDCQEFLKLGAPHSLRGRLWAQILGSSVKTSEQHYSELKQRVLHFDMLIDKFIMKDIKQTACNDDQYFVFEDVLHQIMLCFTRDTDVLSVFNNSASNPILMPLKGEPPIKAIYPPNGIIPFHGFTMFAAPVCYLFNDPVPLYYTFREFYLRYWFRLHEISSHPQSILGLCILFQRLLQRHETKIWSHFMSRNIHPIRVVFKWIMKGFSGHLLSEQLLNLWDMVIAYDSLEVLSLLAVAILSFRKENLLRVNTLQNVDLILEDLSSLNVISLLQLALKGPIEM